jgi:lipoprotein-anchoring transpeptidase ErfK/SrfK
VRDHFRFDWSRRRTARKAIAAIPVIPAAIAALATGCGTASRPHAATTPLPVQPRQVSAAQMARLPTATTNGTTPAAPPDPAPFAAETGIVLHPAATRVVYSRPGGPPAALLPARQLGSPTWVPVVQTQPGWDRVLLPTRPNRSTGWVYLGGGGLQTAYTPYQIEIDLAAYRLTVLDASRSLGSWTVAEGTKGTPTPAGRTFLLASLVPSPPTYSPLILPLGLHSDTLTSYGGGPGTVGLHGWPDPAVFGHPDSHGCVRVPPAALRALARVPLGSPVMITSQQATRAATAGHDTGPIPGGDRLTDQRSGALTFVTARRYAASASGRAVAASARPPTGGAPRWPPPFRRWHERRTRRPGGSS